MTFLPFDAAQITSGENRSNPQPGDPSPTLADTGRTHVAYALRADPGGTGQGHNVTYVPMGFAWKAGGDTGGSHAVDGTPTLPRSQTLAVNTATAVRRLTPTECERLQGYPDGWTATSNGKSQADSARYRQMGNSVAVPCVQWVASRIVDHDRRAA